MTVENHDKDVSGELDLTPPKDYESWLEYAVATFDASVALGPGRDDADGMIQRVVRAEVWAEFNVLRSRAGLPALEPKGLIPPLKEDNLAKIPQKTEREAVALDSQVPIEQNSRSLLDLMDKMPLADGIEFDPSPVVIGLRTVDFDSED